MKRPTIALGLLALFVYLPAFWWGAPHATGPDRVSAWGVDDESPLGPLAEIHNIIEPKPDRNLGYPLMHPFVVAAAYAPYMGYLWATGSLERPHPDFPYGFEDPAASLRWLTWIAHLVSVAFAVVAVLAAYHAAKLLWDPQTGVLAALFALTTYPMIYYGRTANVDAVMHGFMALALLAFAAVLARGTSVRLLTLVGIFVGLSVATKEQVAAVYLALPPVLLFRHWQHSGAPPVSWRYWKPIACCVLGCFIAFGLGSGLFVDPERFFAHLDFIRGRLGESAGGEIAFTTTYPWTVAGSLALGRRIIGYLVDSMSLPGVLAAGAGVVWAFRYDRRSALLILPVVTYLAVLFGAARIVYLRYLIPVTFPLALFAGRAVVGGWRQSSRWVRLGAATLCIGALGLGLGRAVDLTHAMAFDSRLAAGSWLEENAAPGARLEYFGPSQKLPPLREDFVTDRAIDYLGGFAGAPTDVQTVGEIARGWQARRPDYIVIMPDYTSPEGTRHSASCPPATYDGLVTGRYGYELVASFETPSVVPWVRRPRLDYWLVNPPIQIFAPTERGESLESG